MSFVIFGDLFTFPEGNAATNRVYNYAIGFIENGISTHVICFRNEFNFDKKGNLNGINYAFPFSPKKRNKFFFIRILHRISKYFNTIKIFREINNAEKIIAINCYSRQFSVRLFAILIAKIYKSKILLESSEHPLQFVSNSLYSRILYNIELYFTLRLFDGILCISEYLVKFYESKGIKRQKLFIVPSTVDTSRFLNHQDSPLSCQYIVYCGGLSILKDGVNILIRSFAEIADKYINLSLVLIGAADSSIEEAILKELVKELNLENRIYFLGQIPREEIPAYLYNAKILALSRPKSMIADAGFPSKLTEYLATGKPVVVTDVGEITYYLKDNNNAFISKPDNVVEFSNKLDFVLQNYSLSLKIGEKGKELTETVFNYIYQAKRVIDFIKSL